MEATPITQLLKSFCDYTHWKYAVFWKLNHDFPMTLTWENGYHVYHKTNEAVKTMPSEINFKGMDEMFPSGSESFGCSGDYSFQLLVAELSHLKYILGEGVVGNIALTGEHFWVFCEDIFTSKFNTNLISECPYEWLLQIASGIKTIVLVPVLPLGVLQFGSSETVAEDLAFIANIKEKFNSIHCMEGNTSTLNSDKDILAWPLSAQTNCVVDNFEGSFCVTNNILKDKFSASISPDINQTTRLPSYIPYECCVSGAGQLESLNRSNESEVSFPSAGASNDLKHIGQPEMTLNHIEAGTRVCSQLVNNDVGIFGETSNGVCSYPGQQSGDADIDNKGFKNLNSSFYFPSDSELHKALGPITNRLAIKSLPKCFSVDDTHSSSTFIPDRKGPDHIDDLPFPKQGDTKCILDVVVGHLCSASDDTLNTSNHIMSPVNLPKEFTVSIKLPSQSEESTMMIENSDPSSHITPAFVAECRDDWTKHFTSESIDGNASTLIEETNGYGHREHSSTPKLSGTGKKRAKVGSNPRPRPRDRQLIMDRMKELRELVPDGSKCSIDNLLDRTIKHMLYLRNITNRAEKLKHCERLEVSGCKKQKTSGNHAGRSCAYDFESEPQLCPIIIEDLECSGHMLIEMICSESGLFLEIAQVIRRMELTILKGVLETRSSTTWAHFIVEAPRGFHRMDILCPLLHLLQLRRNPVSTSA